VVREFCDALAGTYNQRAKLLYSTILQQSAKMFAFLQFAYGSARLAKVGLSCLAASIRRESSLESLT
jgi:hypothetical protein